MKTLIKSGNSLVTLQASFETSDNETAFGDTLVGHIYSKGVTPIKLVKLFKEALLFPKPSGMNYDALYDRLTDFGWIEQERIVIVWHDVSYLMTKMPEHFLMILDIIRDAQDHWANFDARLALKPNRHLLAPQRRHSIHLALVDPVLSSFFTLTTVEYGNVPKAP